ncbi:hypothetical protein U1Q18_046183 [Sarracenia purpurea var. burkii]
MSGDRKRIVKLFCPSLSMAVPFVTWDDQRLDLGSIARAFGLEPATLKLNGHFISRGVDLIASTVTWKSLFSFFSSRGLSTGATDADALIVDGKLSKVGTKRAHDTADAENRVCYAVKQHQIRNVNMRPPLEDTNLLKRKKLMQSSSESVDGENKDNKCDGVGLKRKQSIECVSPLKRIRMAENNSGSKPRENGIFEATSNTQFRCSLICANTKRIREDEMVVSAPCKKIR